MIRYGTEVRRYLLIQRLGLKSLTKSITNGFKSHTLIKFPQTKTYRSQILHLRLIVLAKVQLLSKYLGEYILSLI